MEDQYDGRTVDYFEYLQRRNPNIQFHRDGLTVRFTVPSSTLIRFSLLSLQEKECKTYQLACQSLCSSLPLHTMVDDTRHEGGSTMVYQREEGLVNPEAYETTATAQGEQGGVAHLVHGWIQQNQVEGVMF